MAVLCGVHQGRVGLGLSWGDIASDSVLCSRGSFLGSRCKVAAFLGFGLSRCFGHWAYLRSTKCRVAGQALPDIQVALDSPAHVSTAVERRNSIRIPHRGVGLVSGWPYHTAMVALVCRASALASA